MNFNLSEKITFMNKLCGETLDITYYTQWELNSYGECSLFSGRGGYVGPVRASDFTECVDKAFKLATEVADNVKDIV